MPTAKNPGGKKVTKYLTPALIWEHFEAYKAATKANPIIVKDWVGKDAVMVEREKERPLTLDGFENYLIDKNIVKWLGDYLNNKDQRYSNFTQVIARIKRVVRQDQIEGGMAMIYNPSITQRLNGLVEKTENKHEVSEIIIKHES